MAAVAVVYTHKKMLRLEICKQVKIFPFHVRSERYGPRLHNQCAI